MPPYMIPGKEVLLIHLTLGNPPSSYGTPPVKNCTTLWEALDLTGFFRQFPRLEHLWVVDEAYPLQKFLLLHLEDSSYPADYFCLSLQRYLCEHCDSLPFTGIIYPEAIPYSELWECAKKIRSFPKIMCSPLQAGIPVSSKRHKRCLPGILQRRHSGSLYPEYGESTSSVSADHHRAVSKRGAACASDL